MPGQPTVADRLRAIREDLVTLAAACNKDGIYEVAAQAQVALVAVSAIDPDDEIPYLAAWPPQVTENDGETNWRVHPC